jgi:multidrug resistance efflux pump
MLPLRVRIRHLTKRLAPVAILAATLGGAASLHFSDGFNGSIPGVTELTVREVSSGEPGRITEIRFDVEQVVRKGDIIAMLDNVELDAELEDARAEKLAMSASVDAERKRVRLDVDDELNDLRRELQKQREEAMAASAAAKAMASERGRIEGLITGKQAVMDDLSNIALKEAEVKSLAAAKPAHISLLNTQIEELSERRSRGAVTGDLEAQVELADRKVRSLELRKAALVLRAPSDGKIIDVLKRPGEFVPEGIPVVRMVASKPRVLACILEGRYLDYPAGTKALVRRLAGSRTPLTGRVSSRSPAVELLPEQCRPNPMVLYYGRKIVIELDGSPQLLPGESVEIELVQGSAAATAGVVESTEPTVASTDELGVSVIKVPSGLADATRFEPSGIVREPGKDNYLLVSDDTGQGNDRTPLLFRMNAAGEVAEKTVEIDGIDEVTDLESIATKDSTVYVLSSQSRSKRGKRPRARTMFLALAPSGDDYKVQKSLHLIEVLANESAEFLTGLGLPRIDDLEIEGMTQNGGALYFGLKAPLDAQGRALVWKLARPDDLFAGKSARDAGLSLYARVPLSLGGGESVVRGGIAELVFVGSDLAISSTPSTDDLVTGALFKLTSPGSEPTLVKSFHGKKPEGLAVTLKDPKRIVVVFDNGSKTGEMTELPWP